MGMAGEEGAEMKMGTFVISAPQNARIEVAPDGDGDASADTLTVKRVVAPVDGWVVVRSAGATGGVVGRAAVKRGESRDVVVALANPDVPNLRVALHIDGGARGEFELDATGFRRLADRPVFALGVPVEEAVLADVFGFKPVSNSALIKVEDQPLTAGSLTVNYLRLPELSWVVVNLAGDDGLPGERIGLVRLSGESQQIDVPLSKKVSDGDVIVTALIDKGEPVSFEYEPVELTVQPVLDFHPFGMPPNDSVFARPAPADTCGLSPSRRMRAAEWRISRSTACRLRCTSDGPGGTAMRDDASRPNCIRRRRGVHRLRRRARWCA